ncbi:hypothetical protein M409DRAFT_28762 [Zasmidium cellare ATCC 36951]|uniref:RING-type domain-containing protein n=1 Tax=Zasmidium cellare ATCC 36951 TaxID=1080233 RepID=A0A6A6C4T7_ZASCE|nr:uncharacterized protein M409DRAFT_28762 [Zasmidium cellare ATCC 36951]KAF2160882.1 hypothetical protein M409DRAFT_28762 [Zasmidium cellare ATCC 36951]
MDRGRNVDGPPTHFRWRGIRLRFPSQTLANGSLIEAPRSNPVAALRTQRHSAGIASDSTSESPTQASRLERLEAPGIFNGTLRTPLLDPNGLPEYPLSSPASSQNTPGHHQDLSTDSRNPLARPISLFDTYQASALRYQETGSTSRPSDRVRPALGPFVGLRPGAIDRDISIPEYSTDPSNLETPRQFGDYALQGNDAEGSAQHAQPGGRLTHLHMDSDPNISHRPKALAHLIADADRERTLVELTAAEQQQLRHDLGPDYPSPEDLENTEHANAMLRTLGRLRALSRFAHDTRDRLTNDTALQQRVSDLFANIMGEAPRRRRPRPRIITLPTCQAEEGSEQCAICWEPTEGMEVSDTACGHSFHTECMNEWREDNANPTCPMCRGALG